MTDIKQNLDATFSEEFELFKEKFNEWRKDYAALIGSDGTYFHATETATNDNKRVIELVITQTFQNGADWTLHKALQKFFETLTQEHTFTKIALTHTIKIPKTETFPLDLY